MKKQFEWTVVRYVKFYLSMPRLAAKSREKAERSGSQWDNDTAELFLGFFGLTFLNLVFLAMTAIPPFPVNLIAPALVLSPMFFFDYLMTGRALTQLVAIGNLGVGSVTKRVSELRALGLDVKSAWQRDHNDQRYKKYWVETDNEG